MTATGGTVLAAVAWYLLGVIGFVLPFILGGEWHMLNGLGVLPIILWALVDAIVCCGRAAVLLFRAKDSYEQR